VPYYLIEVYIPRARAHEADSTGRRIRAAIDALPGADVEIRFVRTMFLPEDETCFHIVDAPSRAEVQHLCKSAGLSSIRVVSAIEGPSGAEIVLDAGESVDPPTTFRFMELRVCVTDDEYEAWRAVRLAVEPESRTHSLEEMRAADSSDRLLLLAVKDGDVVGSGIADRGDTAGAGFVAPRVLPGHRRVGVGSALLRVLAEHCSGLGLPTVGTSVDDEGSLAFAERFGFVEVDREVEQVRAVGDEPTPTGLPAGVEVIEASQRPDLWAACFETFGKEVLADFAVYSPLEISEEQWNTTWYGDPMFLALYDDEVIGCAGLNRDTDRPERAENALTGVRRTWRGRGIASHLKRRTLQWAALNGLEEIYTWTQAGNSSMLRLNEHLGYVTTRNGITVSRALPLTI
jgi:mycothiol synthase